MKAGFEMKNNQNVKYEINKVNSSYSVVTDNHEYKSFVTYKCANAFALKLENNNVRFN